MNSIESYIDDQMQIKFDAKTMNSCNENMLDYYGKIMAENAALKSQLERS